MKSSLDGRPSTFSDSLFGTVCFFLFVDLPNLTAACAAQVAKQGVLSSFRHGYTFWCCSFRNRGLVTILLHLYLYTLHHNSSRITRFLLRFCVSIQCVYPCLTSQQICKRKVSLILHQHLRWPMCSACRVAWEATESESSRFFQLIRLQDGSAESLPMHIRLGLEVGMLTITCCYFCLQRPRCPNYSELIVSQNNFLVAISRVATCAKLK